MRPASDPNTCTLLRNTPTASEEGQYFVEGGGVDNGQQVVVVKTEQIGSRMFCLVEANALAGHGCGWVKAEYLTSITEREIKEGSMLPTTPYTTQPPAWGAPLLPGGQRGRGPLTSSLGRSPEIRTEAEIFDTGVKLEGNLEQRFAEEEETKAAGKMVADRPAAEEAAAAKAAAEVWVGGGKSLR